MMLLISAGGNKTKTVENYGPAYPFTLKDKIIELEESLYLQKKGALYKALMGIIEKPIIERALERCQGNQLKAAEILGINRNTIRAKIKKLGINTQVYKP